MLRSGLQGRVSKHPRRGLKLPCKSVSQWRRGNKCGVYPPDFEPVSRTSTLSSISGWMPQVT
jgi:hypothetical protein